MQLLSTYYGFIPIIGVFCTLNLFFLIFSCIKSKKFLKVKDIICIPFLLLGIYLLIPFSVVYIGVLNKNPTVMHKALRLSIFPFEKSEIYYQMGRIYDTIEGKFDGKLAIRYYEKSINGNYKNNSTVSNELARLYLYKGDYNKTIAIESQIKSAYKINSIYAYIMQNKYKEAMTTAKNTNIHGASDVYLKGDLYIKLGQVEIGLREKNTTLKTIAMQSKKAKGSTDKINFALDVCGVDCVRQKAIYNRKKYKFQ